MSGKLYCPECGNYLMAGDGECHDCNCGWTQESLQDREHLDGSNLEDRPLTERTYGLGHWTLEQIESDRCSDQREKDLVAHIRELEAEKEARGKLCEDLAKKIDELQAENAKLKYDRREFALHLAREVECAAINAERGGMAQSIEEIVEQELAK